MAKALLLLPAPRKVEFRAGTFQLPPKMRVHAATDESGGEPYMRTLFADKAGALCRTVFTLSGGHGTGDNTEIRMMRDPSLLPTLRDGIRNQAYRLTIAKESVQIRAMGHPGFFYALQTLLQLIRIFTDKTGRTRLPCLDIEDYPDFERRGVYHDTARGKVPKLETMLQLIDDLAHLKINEFQLYIENNFRFKKHPAMYNDTDPFTPEELQAMDRACQARHIDFVPSLTSLGHFDKIVSRPRYRRLAEATAEDLAKTDIPPGWAKQAPWSLCVTDPGSKKLLKEMYDDFLPPFSSGYFNICCDEAFDLGYGRSKRRADKIGRGRLYLEWIQFCNRLAKAHGRQIQLWGDIIINHPELVSELPADATILEWGYEADHKFDEHCELFVKHARQSAQPSDRRELYVCPGTSTWLTFAGRSKNAFENMHNAARAALKHGAKGILITDWGDRGHQQMLAVSLLPMAYGAATAWNVGGTARAGEDGLANLLKAISRHALQDRTGGIARTAYELGLTYERIRCYRMNASVDWFLFREPWGEGEFLEKTPAAGLRATSRGAHRAEKACRSMRLDHPDADLIRAEFIHTAAVIAYTCERTLARQAALSGKAPSSAVLRRLDTQCATLEKDFRTLWLSRNKRSRMADVVTEFRKHRREYRKLSR